MRENINIVLGIKILFVLLIIVCAIVVTVLDKKNYKNCRFIIKQGDNTYYTETFTKDSNGCIIFKSITSFKERNNNIIICGNYTIVENVVSK